MQPPLLSLLISPGLRPSLPFFRRQFDRRASVFVLIQFVQIRPVARPLVVLPFFVRPADVLALGVRRGEPLLAPVDTAAELLSSNSQNLLL